jgi:hypothetical protein
MASTDKAVANMGAAALLQGDKDGLESHLTVKSCLRDAADILEGTLQPFARLRLQMYEIVGMRPLDRKNISVLSFGDVIDELSSISPGGQIYKPVPFGIPVSQWRNIANHNSYETNGDRVICTYGKSGKTKRLECSAEDIFNLACHLNDLCFAHKVAIEIFGIDNMDEVAKWAPDSALSDYSKDAVLAFGLVSSGFSVRFAQQHGQEWRLKLIDRRKRGKPEIKAALQEAVLSYALMNQSAHIEAAVDSGGALYRLGFKTSFAHKHELKTARLLGDIRSLDEYFRLRSKE